jgi:esterase/lipase
LRSGPTLRSLSLGIAVLLLSCAPMPELGKRHQPSQLATPLPTPDFEAYVVAAQQYIAAANQTAGNPLADAVVADRGPFELLPDGPGCRRADAPGGRGALLIHDLGATPYELRDLGERLARDCYRVRAILLPGHGGVPGDLLYVDHDAWRTAVRQGVASFAGSAAEVTLVGFGTGGTLALDYVLADPPEAVPVAALVLLAPAMAEAATPIEAQAQHFYHALAPADAWPAVFADNDPVRYESLPSNAQRQGERLILELARQQGPLDLPVFMAISEEDASVDATAALRWFCTSVAGRRQMLWYSAAPDAAPDVAETCGFVAVRSSAPTPEALDLSHIGLPIAPGNPRYGRKSGYRSCLHYYWEKDAPSWFFCSDPAKTPANSAVRYGEISQANLAAHVIRRLTYNPDFDHLAAELVGFLDGAR